MALRNVTTQIANVSDIKDPSVRRAVEAVLGAWRVRNGEQNPDSGDRFVSLDELRDAVKGLKSDITNVTNAGGGGGGSTTIITGGGSVGQDMQEIVDYLQTTDLWLDLMDRITLIDGPGGSIVNLDAELTALGVTVDGHTITINGITIDISDINNISGGSPSLIAQEVYGLKTAYEDPVTGLAAAHADIAQINFVDVTSTSAIAGSVAQMSATVNQQGQDIAAAEAAITQINFVDATSTSSAATNIATLKSQVNSPTTGLAAAHAEIGYINNVSTNSNSANARSVALLNAAVNTPTTGLTAQINEINNVSIGSGSANARKLATVDAAITDPNTGLTRAHGRISEDASIRLNSDNVIATQVNTLWAQMGGNGGGVLISAAQNGGSVVANPAATEAITWTQIQSAVRDPNTGQFIASAAIRTEANTAYTLANGFAAQYTVKIDVNGYVSGYGLAIDAPVDNEPSSQFLVNADRFAIGKGGAPSVFPFIAITNPNGQYINGKLYPYGVWMDVARIANATIDFAQITDTLQSSNFQWGTTGWKIYKDGYAQFSNIWARGNIEATSIQAGSANIINTLMLQGNAVTLTLVTRGTSNSLAWNSIYVPAEAVGQPIVIQAYVGMPTPSVNAHTAEMKVTVGSLYWYSGTVLESVSSGSVMTNPGAGGDYGQASWAPMGMSVTTYLPTTYGGWYNIYINWNHSYEGGWYSVPYNGYPPSTLVLSLGKR